MSGNYKYRLVTRSDFDGLVCAILLKEMNLLSDIKFAHPKDVQDGLVEMDNRDIVTNLPYVPECHMCFDHHSSEAVRNGGNSRTNLILDPEAESAARVVYNYFGGLDRFPNIDVQMMAAVDKADSARFERNEVLAPTGWDLMNFIMDPRTGLGRFRKFRISNYDLMMALIEMCRQYPIDQVLRQPDVQERVEVYNVQREHYCEQVARCSTLHGNVLVIDLRGEEIIYAGNRFMPYALYPECDISVHVMPGFKNQNTVLAMGKSIFRRTNHANIGEMALKYGGGGHAAAGTCQVAHEEAEAALADLIDHYRKAGCEAPVAETVS